MRLTNILTPANTMQTLTAGRTKRTKNSRLVAFALAALTVTLPPAHATVGPPLAVTIASPNELKAGKPMTVYAVIEAGEDLPVVNFELLMPSLGWKVEAGELKWIGPMKGGAKRWLVYSLTPMVDDPKPVQARVETPGALPVLGEMRFERLGGRFPEQGSVDEFNPQEEIQEPQPAAEWELELPLPEPAKGPEPRIPGPEQVAGPEQVEGKDLRAAGAELPRRAEATVVATGRFVFIDDRGRTVPVRGATVELRDRDNFPEIGDGFCGVSVTDVNGFYTVSGRCGDPFGDLPDFYVRVVLSNSVVTIKPNDVFAGAYSFRSAVRENVAEGTLSFGTIVVGPPGAFQLHNLVVQAAQFMSSVGERMSPVTVEWPSLSTMHLGVFPRIFITAGDTFAEGETFHEYGHHILSTLAESPPPNYDNGICDPGHCIWSPERGAIAWTEGWPNFFAQLLIQRFGHDPSGRYDFENHFDDRFSGQQAEIEGFVASVLWDLVDFTADDQHGDGVGRRDGMWMSFAQTWDIVRRFDPSGDILHNHPTSLDEFLEGVRVRQHQFYNSAAEVYQEHHITAPQPDLFVSVVGDAPATLTPGAAFAASATIRNGGRAGIVTGTYVRWFLNDLVTRYALANDMWIPALGSGESISRTHTVVTPVWVPSGTYLLEACADTFEQIPEADEKNNCRYTTSKFFVVPR